MPHEDQVFKKGTRASFRNGKLELQWRELTYISRKLSCTLTLQMGHLREVRLTGNRITELPPWAIVAMHGIVELAIGHNQIRRLPSNFGLLAPTLRVFEAEHNLLGSLPDSFCELRNLETLVLTGNLIAKLPVQIGKLKALSNFRFDDNLVRMLPGTFQRMGGLVELQLSRCRLAVSLGGNGAGGLARSWLSLSAVPAYLHSAATRLNCSP